MWHYEPPLCDMRHAIEDVLDLPAQWTKLPAFADLDAETAQQVLGEAAKFARDVLAPTNAGGDLESCRRNGGDVRTPTGFGEAYRVYVGAGWVARALQLVAAGRARLALLPTLLPTPLPTPLPALA